MFENNNNFEKELKSFYISEYHSWRSLSSMIFSMAGITFYAYIYKCLLIFSPFSFSNWIENCLTMILLRNFWITILLFMISIFILHRLNSSYFSVTPNIICRHYEMLWNYISPPRILFYIVYIFLSSLLSILIFNSTKSSITTITSENNLQIDISYYQVYSFLGLAYIIGLFFSLNFFWSHYYVLNFPIALESKFKRMYSNFLPLIISSFKTSFKIVCIFHPLDFFLLSYFSKSFLKFTLILFSAFNLIEIDQTIENDNRNIGNFFDISFLFNLWIMASFLLTFFRLPIILYDIHHTEPISFPIIPRFAFNVNKCLVDALTLKQHAIIQHLALLDLNLVSKYSKNRRSLIFSLSQPGCHPIYWQGIYNECHKQIQEITMSLVNFPIDGSAITNNVIYRKNLFVNEAIINIDSFVRSLNVNEMTDTPKYQCRIRNASQNFLMPGSNCTKKVDIDYSKLTGPTIYDKLSAGLKKIPLVQYICNEQPEMIYRKIFANSSGIILIVESISFLAVSSITEDRYGVVQKNLPELISSLLSLLEALNRPMILSSLGKHNISEELKLKNLLKSETKSALYRIIYAFKDCLNNLNLTQEEMHRITYYREFKDL